MSLETDRTDTFWVETNLKISLSYRLIVLFGPPNEILFENCYIYKFKRRCFQVFLQCLPLSIHEPLNDIVATFSFRKLQIARHLCNQTETEKKFRFYLRKLLLQMYMTLEFAKLGYQYLNQHLTQFVNIFFA